jgi:hypothetical protein
MKKILSALSLTTSMLCIMNVDAYHTLEDFKKQGVFYIDEFDSTFIGKNPLQFQPYQTTLDKIIVKKITDIEDIDEENDPNDDYDLQDQPALKLKFPNEHPKGYRGVRFDLPQFDSDGVFDLNFNLKLLKGKAYLLVVDTETGKIIKNPLLNKNESYKNINLEISYKKDQKLTMYVREDFNVKDLNSKSEIEAYIKDFSLNVKSYTYVEKFEDNFFIRGNHSVKPQGVKWQNDIKNKVSIQNNGLVFEAEDKLAGCYIDLPVLDKQTKINFEVKANAEKGALAVLVYDLDHGKYIGDFEKILKQDQTLSFERTLEPSTNYRIYLRNNANQSTKVTLQSFKMDCPMLINIGVNTLSKQFKQLGLDKQPKLIFPFLSTLIKWTSEFQVQKYVTFVKYWGKYFDKGDNNTKKSILEIFKSIDKDNLEEDLLKKMDLIAIYGSQVMQADKQLKKEFDWFIFQSKKNIEPILYMLGGTSETYQAFLSSKQKEFEAQQKQIKADNFAKEIMKAAPKNYKLKISHIDDYRLKAINYETLSGDDQKEALKLDVRTLRAAIKQFYNGKYYVDNKITYTDTDNQAAYIKMEHIIEGSNIKIYKVGDVYKKAVDFDQIDLKKVEIDMNGCSEYIWTHCNNDNFTYLGFLQHLFTRSKLSGLKNGKAAKDLYYNHMIKKTQQLTFLLNKRWKQIQDLNKKSKILKNEADQLKINGKVEQAKKAQSEFLLVDKEAQLIEGYVQQLLQTYFKELMEQCAEGRQSIMIKLVEELADLDSQDPSLKIQSLLSNYRADILEELERPRFIFQFAPHRITDKYFMPVKTDYLGEEKDNQTEELWKIFSVKKTRVNALKVDDYSDCGNAKSLYKNKLQFLKKDFLGVYTPSNIIDYLMNYMADESLEAGLNQILEKNGKTSQIYMDVETYIQDYEKKINEIETEKLGDKKDLAQNFFAQLGTLDEAFKQVTENLNEMSLEKVLEKTSEIFEECGNWHLVKNHLRKDYQDEVDLLLKNIRTGYQQDHVTNFVHSVSQLFLKEVNTLFENQFNEIVKDFDEEVQKDYREHCLNSAKKTFKENIETFKNNVNWLEKISLYKKDDLEKLKLILKDDIQKKWFNIHNKAQSIFVYGLGHMLTENEIIKISSSFVQKQFAILMAPLTEWKDLDLYAEDRAVRDFQTYVTRQKKLEAVLKILKIIE